MVPISGPSADNYGQYGRPNWLGMVGNAHCLLRGLFFEVRGLQTVTSDISFVESTGESGTHFGGQIGLLMADADRAVRG
jgi:hypothetical protein